MGLSLRGTTFSVCLPTFYLSVCLCICLFALYRLFGLHCFSFSVSVFLQLSEFLSFCKSLCPYLSFSNIISHVCAYVHLCARVSSRRVHEHAWAVMCSCVCFAVPDRVHVCHDCMCESSPRPFCWRCEIFFSDEIYFCFDYFWLE